MTLSYPHFAIEVIIDTLLGIMLGILIDKLSDIIGEHLSFSAKMIVQFILIITVLYVMKNNSKYLYESWVTKGDYGILFTAVFLTSQKNVIMFMNKVYHEE